jgi:HAD superfamily hydrolase (TIGR01549 family)
VTNPIAAILFDLDNTLLDRDATFRAFAARFVARYFPELGAGQSRELIERLVLLDEDGYRSKPELFGQLLEELPFAPGVTAEELLAFYAEHYVESAAAMEGAEELLRLCRAAGLRIGLVTNGRTSIQLGKLRRLGWEDRFDAVLVSEAAGCRKPDRAIFERALNELKAKPEEALFVGDHPANDVGGAHGAGIGAVWLRRNQPWLPGAPEPLHAVTSLPELRRWLAGQGILPEEPDHDRVYAEQADKYERLIAREDYEGSIPAAIDAIVDLTGKDVADLGAGTGRLSVIAAPKARSLTAFDKSAAMLEVLAGRLRSAGCRHWRAEVADHRRLPLADASVDVAMAGWTLCYLASANNENWRANLAEMQAELERVVRPGGTILIFETLGTGTETPQPPDHLLPYYNALESDYGYRRTELRTDYRFGTPDEAAELTAFFFGPSLARRVRESGSVILPECTGLWWKRL